MSHGPSKIIPALWGGILIVVISTVPGVNVINVMCCSGIIAGGVLAVHLYKRKGGEVSASVGLELGLYSGLIATAISAIVIYFVMPYLPHVLHYFEGLIDQPDIDEILEQVSPEMLTRGFFLIVIGASLIFNVVFAGIGGLVGSSLTSGKKSSPNSSGGDEDAIIVEKVDF
jgi:hypothetical protein